MLQAVKVCLENAPDVQKECVFYREGALRCVYFLEEVLSTFEESLPEGIFISHLILNFNLKYTA